MLRMKMDLVNTHLALDAPIPMPRITIQQPHRMMVLAIMPVAPLQRRATTMQMPRPMTEVANSLRAKAV